MKWKYYWLNFLNLKSEHRAFLFKLFITSSIIVLYICHNRKDVVNVRKAKIVRASHEVRAATLSGDGELESPSSQSCCHEYCMHRCRIVFSLYYVQNCCEENNLGLKKLFLLAKLMAIIIDCIEVLGRSGELSKISIMLGY